jgi:DNA-binding transcriptional LysR family regulator
MAQRSPGWHLYRSFLATVREGSLSAASRALGLTQPTLSRHIEALEQDLGLVLFTRSLDGVLATAAALRLVPAAEAMSAAADLALRAASGEVTEDSGTVRITVTDIVGAEVLPEILSRFHACHPNIAFEVALTNRNEDILRGDADIAIRMDRPTQGALLAQRIGQIDIGLFAHESYLKARGTPRRPEELQSHSLIGSDRDPDAARLLAKWGVTLPRETLSYRADSDLAQIAALRAGFGIGGLQLGIARREPALVAVLPEFFTFSLVMWLAMHSDQRSSRRVRLVFDYLKISLGEYVQFGSRHATPETGLPGPRSGSQGADHDSHA